MIAFVYLLLSLFGVHPGSHPPQVVTASDCIVQQGTGTGVCPSMFAGARPHPHERVDPLRLCSDPQPYALAHSSL